MFVAISAVVSIPHRYCKNGIYGYVNVLDEVQFQFLIGTVKTVRFIASNGIGDDSFNSS